MFTLELPKWHLETTLVNVAISFQDKRKRGCQDLDLFIVRFDLRLNISF